jgi:heavy metal sensor kinase
VTRWWRSHSVRVRLTLWHLGAMAIVLGVYVFAVYAFVSRSVSESLDQQLRRDFGWASASVYLGDDGGFTLIEPVYLFTEEEVAWVQVWAADGRTLLFRNAEALRRPIPESQRLAAAAQADGRPVSVAADPAPIRILSHRLGIRTMPGASRTPVVIQVARSEAAMRQELRDLALIFMFGLPVAVAVAGLGGYTVARRALAPIERMTEHARTITAARLSDRLPVHNPDDEMGRLAAVFNQTLARLEESFDQMRRFTADVSHELRTPLTSIRSVGEVGLRGHRDEAGYRAIIGSMLEEADRLASLVDRLLTLSRAETRQAKLASEMVGLRELAEDVAAHLGVLAEEKGQTITVDGRGEPQALADRLVLRQALISLVDNAIKFTPPHGRIRVRFSGTPAEAVVDVIDSGPGVSPEGRTRIFDRFFRGEGTDAGGAGLGLSIAKGAVEANGGRLTLEATGPAGSTFRISMPSGRKKEVEKWKSGKVEKWKSNL